MRQKSGTRKAPAEKVIKGQSAAVTRRQYSAEERIPASCLRASRRGSRSPALCLREGIPESPPLQTGRKDFLEAGQEAAAGDHGRAPATKR